jgi:ribosomal protein L2
MTPDKDLLRIKHDTLKHHKPLTNSLRNRVSLDCKKAGLWRGRPFKPLTLPKKRTGGRNNTGRITCRHRGGGNKRRYRIIDFKRQLWDVPATVERLEYDPNRSAFISLLNYDNGVVAYILAPQGLEVGDRVVAGQGPLQRGIEPRPGNAAPFKYLPLGIHVHNVELNPGQGGKLVRSAGTSAIYQSRTEDGFAVRTRAGRLSALSVFHSKSSLYGDFGWACRALNSQKWRFSALQVLKMPSKELRMVPIMCMASVGQVSNRARAFPVTTFSPW